jgi:hypothetical protein
MPDLEEQIDRLYQLPLEDFTTARNQLAKDAKQSSLKTLEKPSIAAWAVNQLYWQYRDDYERLTRASEHLRREHRKVLSGKSSDLREGERAHREAVRQATDRIRNLLREGGHAASDQTLAAVQETLEALPAGERPGRLTRPLKPLGFEALAGVTISPTPRRQLRVVPPRTATETPAPRDAKRERELARQRAREECERKERQREAEKALKAAEAAMLRAEDAVKQAEKALAEARARRDEAVSEYQRARLRAHE